MSHLNQINIDQSRTNSNNSTKKERYIDLIETIQKGKSQIFVFSETDYPYIIRNNNIVNHLQNLLSKDQILIIGGIRKDLNNYYNSMYFIEKKSFQIFDKKILVPFGEFLPFRNTLTFLESIVGSVDFSVGKRDRFIKFNSNLSFIPVICYEIIFFNNLLERVNDKSPLLINITNDAWFGKYSGPYQHFYLSRIRSVEFNKYLIRVSNNGVSAIIDNFGKVIKFLPLNIKAQHNTKLIIPKKLNNLVNYHRFIFLIIFFIILFIIMFERKIGKSNSEI